MSGFIVSGKILGDVIWPRIYSNPYNYGIELWKDSVIFNQVVLIFPFINNVNILDYKCPSYKQFTYARQILTVQQFDEN